MESKHIKLNISDYSEYPGPRYCTQGPESGEDFYHKYLNHKFAEAYKEKKKLLVNLDGTAGYASSFLDEAFGNLVYDFTKEIVNDQLEILSKEEPDWKDMIINDVYNIWEERRLDKKKPKMTIKHDKWYRFDNGKLALEVWE